MATKTYDDEKHDDERIRRLWHSWNIWRIWHSCNDADTGHEGAH